MKLKGKEREGRERRGRGRGEERGRDRGRGGREERGDIERRESHSTIVHRQCPTIVMCQSCANHVGFYQV